MGILLERRGGGGGGKREQEGQRNPKKREQRKGNRTECETSTGRHGDKTHINFDREECSGRMRGSREKKYLHKKEGKGNGTKEDWGEIFSRRGSTFNRAEEKSSSGTETCPRKTRKKGRGVRDSKTR